jgi:CheY-like chemotaxis protein
LRVVSTSLWINTDPRLLERILLNLVANAIRYTASGRIAIGCRRRGAHAEIIVADTGVGISGEHLSRVFQEFYQVDNPERDRTQGLGLGLAIVQRVAALLEHPLTLRSQPGHGTVFGVRVPIAPPQAPHVDEKITAGHELAGRRALVVDDDVTAREAMTGMLARWGCSVMGASDRGTALAAAANATPDVVLCDLRLRGGEDGIDVLEALRPTCGPTAVCVIVTGDIATESARSARARGYALLHKPVHPAKLRALLEQLLRERASA